MNISRELVVDILFYRTQLGAARCYVPTLRWSLGNLKIAVTGVGRLILDDYAAVAVGDNRLAATLRRARK